MKRSSKPISPDVQKIAEMLEPLGFHHSSNGIFTHNTYWLDKDGPIRFDLSATNPDHAMWKILQIVEELGFERGQERMRSDFRNLLEVPER